MCIMYLCIFILDLEFIVKWLEHFLGDLELLIFKLPRAKAYCRMEIILKSTLKLSSQ